MRAFSRLGPETTVLPLALFSLGERRGPNPTESDGLGHERGRWRWEPGVRESSEVWTGGCSAPRVFLPEITPSKSTY